MFHTAQELATAAKDAAGKKTLYVLGCFGAPMTKNNQERWLLEQSYNRKPEREAKIKAAAADTFGFDCVGFLKALLWDWSADNGQEYGGAKYQSNGVPDIDERGMLNACTDISEDFSNIQIGEYLWMAGHCGIYIGDGLAVECTPKWNDGVQITAVLNIGEMAGCNGRCWTKHGKLPYVVYEAESPAQSRYYRIRTGWEDAASQIGAYIHLDNAKAACADGYKVFDWNGEQVYPTAEKADTVHVGLPVLKKGAKGDSVRALQALLIGHGYKMSSGTTAYGIDGSFGGATDRAVREYQQKNGLSVDGSVGSATWSRLLGVK